MALQAFHYVEPEGLEGREKATINVCSTDLLRIGVQVVRNGGETNLHAHVGFDSYWWVVSGHAAFYDGDDNRFELGPNDSLVIPSGTKYWFESVGDEPLEILHIVAKDTVANPQGTGRVDINSEHRQRPGAGSGRLQAEEILPVQA